MGFKDVRQFIEALDKTGDVIRIKDEVDWELEAAAISRRAYERYGPAVFFEKIKDYPEGYRIFNGSLGTYRRVAISLGRRLPVASSRPTRRSNGTDRPVSLRSPSCLVLLPVGFTLPVLSPAPRCALTAPFHPYLCSR